MVSAQDFGLWFDVNVDLPTRTIYLGSVGSTADDYETGVDHHMAALFIKAMHTLESDNKKPIQILMNNPGGDWYHGMAIYDAIACSPCKVKITVYGQAMSMGSIILQAADIREMMPNSRLMIHYGQDGQTGHAKTVERWADESKRIARRMEDLYLDKIMKKAETVDIAVVLTSIITRLRELEWPFKKTKSIKLSSREFKKREEIREILKGLLTLDTVLTPKETIDLGLADSIIRVNKNKS